MRLLTAGLIGATIGFAVALIVILNGAPEDTGPWNRDIGPLIRPS